ncbi:4-amino-4-deoxychorismate lyase [Orenia metallireducens]|uniref:4-amino-4-deoxychorismate lyase n=1 Tax=Orenia metallireducens TaxID=1413210 RepID=A0A285HCM5_9FIRM|nr:aminotransferase class IV [Orenia metallireducens]PRX28897.1 4-amino-4-deoxychorismate lyase [Orenia metallireducens]SNY32411.1 4-amino-4-deoxychorismate lyase [Orenia metallireducens]
MKNNVAFDSELAKFGIGLFETIKIWNSHPIFLKEHLERLYSSIEELKVPFEMSKEELIYEILDYSGGVKYQALRVTICAAGYNFSLRDINYSAADYEEGYRVKVASFKRGSSPLHRHKTANYWENIYARREALGSGYNEALLLNTDDKILEGSISNTFFIKDEVLYTPSKELELLPGIIRAKVIETAKKLDIEVKQEKININEIVDFDFAFLTNSLMDLMKVRNIEEIEYDKQNSLFDSLVSEFNHQAYGIEEME